MAIPQPILPPTEPEFELPKPYDELPAPYGSTGASSPIANFFETKSTAQPITNTSVPTSADKSTNNFWETSNGQAQKNSSAIAAPFGYGSGMNKLQSNQQDKPENYLSPEARKMLGYGNAALGGMAAGGQVAPTPDAQDAALQVLGAGVGGAAAGFAAGGPVGGIVGGVAGLVAGGINAYVGTHSARNANRKEEKIRRDIQAREEARYQQARADQEKYFNIQRGDNLEKEKYNRKMAAVQSQWAAQEKARAALNDTIAQDASFKHMLVGELR